MPRAKSKFARPLVVVLALLLMGALYSAVRPAVQVAADPNMSQQVAMGKDIFDVTCSSCHGLDAKGTSAGPSLIGVGAAAVDFQMGTGRMPMARTQPQAPRKPTDYSEEEINAVAAYVASLSKDGYAIPKPNQYDSSGLTEEDIAVGGEIFKANCSQCHGIAGHGGALPNGKYAPSLVGVEGKHIYEALRTGPQEMPRFTESSLSDHEVKSVVTYLEEIHEQPSWGGLGLGNLGPVSEGFWAWLLGIGTLVGFAIWIAKRGARAE